MIKSKFNGRNGPDQKSVNGSKLCLAEPQKIQAAQIPATANGNGRVTHPPLDGTSRVPAQAGLSRANVAIIGLGYVGLPLALQFARSGTRVIGLDIDSTKTHALNRGRSYIKHVSGADVKRQVASGAFSASTNFSEIRYADAVLICVPTPLNKNREPDISYILETGRAIAPHLRRGMIVVLESTTYPGTTDEDLRAVLEDGSGLKAGIDFHLAFSPEREDPGNANSRVADIPKVIGGLTPVCLQKAMSIYGRAIKNLVPVSSCRAAESTKLLENIFRAVNIALVNELKVIYGAMDIDIWEVIAAAKTKPFGFMPFYPGPGLGGHCIPIDPFYLTWKSREYGQITKFIELAGEVNTAMPKYVVSRLTDGLNDRKKALNGSRILLLGLAYKADVDDMRESPTFVLMDLLTKGGATVAYHDPHIPVIRPTREHGHWTGTKSVVWDQKTISRFDAVLISTAHKAVDYSQLAQWAPLIIDTRNAMAGIKCRRGQLWKA
jgi:UDP-N-acetyl-D-glucosamine dehydrogenase